MASPAGRLPDTRPSARRRGYDTRWDKARKTYLSHHPLCVLCRREGRVTTATVVDHRVPHRGDTKVFWDRDNWQPVCTTHHNRKTATEDSSFAKSKRGQVDADGLPIGDHPWNR